MKSPEQMGESPEKPPESYNEAEWDKLKQGGPAFAINKGKEIGVPQEELDRFAEEVIARETERKNYDFVYRFREGMGIGTKEEIRAIGEKAYQSFFDAREFGSAMAMADDVYGRESEEWRRANEANEAEWKEMEEKRKRKEEGAEGEERELVISISKDATFADLFKAIDAIEEKEGLSELHFEDELWDNFDPNIVEEVLAFRDAQASKAVATRVLDFFKERGYAQKDVSAFLPIKFKRERRAK